MRISIVGTGQLARLMALAAHSLKLDVSFLRLGDDDYSSVDGLGRVVTATPTRTAVGLYRDLGRPDVITVDRESVDIDLLKSLQAFCSVDPAPEIIELTQHRLKEKYWVAHQLNLPTADYLYCDDGRSLFEAAETLKFPLIAKSCESGYDGKNQWRLNDLNTLESCWEQIVKTEAIVEKQVSFQKEVSLIGVRNAHGDTRFYPLAENYHQNGVLVSSEVGINALPDKLAGDAQNYLRALMSSGNYVGVMAMECFVTDKGLLINELAPRVHNSGHWTLTGSATNQFENHLRAITGMPLGSTELLAPTAMVNLLGVTPGQVHLVGERAHVYDYHKALKPGRKMGHINCSLSEPWRLRQWLDQQLNVVYGWEEKRVAS
ncbi:5-(carboxyamino)imidazole ribonucleotide synthase [Porticoccus sp. W117]|uniref:5-(carboxyamino)imidazole ribonucleotide synthase n=1 Tax=Porticoccus sp. W117 TaxID=3054777 RepID=UPI002595CE66|nr:5-(carboxyamino)imidazole ribonucleotide synthase [Porticoccus sp. W117]MDM3871206.1 5-(carboxyamino)imidazole ribonucleotide synthase [Porticoccus sp. W117]